MDHEQFHNLKIGNKIKLRRNGEVIYGLYRFNTREATYGDHFIITILEHMNSRFRTELNKQEAYPEYLFCMPIFEDEGHCIELIDRLDSKPYRTK